VQSFPSVPGIRTLGTTWHWRSLLPPPPWLHSPLFFTWNVLLFRARWPPGKALPTMPFPDCVHAPLPHVCMFFRTASVAGFSPSPYHPTFLHHGPFFHTLPFLLVRPRFFFFKCFVRRNKSLFVTPPFLAWSSDMGSSPVSYFPFSASWANFTPFRDKSFLLGDPPVFLSPPPTPELVQRFVFAALRFFFLSEVTSSC